MNIKVGQYILNQASREHVSYSFEGTDEQDCLSPAALAGLLYTGIPIEDWVNKEWQMDDSQDSQDFIEFWRQVRASLVG